MIEILQTIWTSLTTENETLINYITIPFYFIEIYISMLFFTTIFNIKATTKKKFIYVLSVSIIGIIIDLIVPNPYDTFLNAFIFLISTMIIFKINFLKSLLAIIIPFIITIILELLFSRIYFLIFQAEYTIGMNIPLHRIIGTFIMYAIMFLIYLLLKYLKINFSKIQIVSKKHKYLLISNIVFGIILIGTQLYILTFYTYLLPTFILILSILSIAVYVAISLYTIFTVSKLETTSTNLEEAQLYNKTLEILQDNTRAFRHDFANILQGMVGYMDNNDMDGLKKYYSQLVDDIQTSNNLTTLSPKVVNNPAIYNVLATKYHKADSLGIKIHLEAFLDMNDLHMKIYEFTRVLGILMDNAIEASSECENKIINETFKNDNRKHMQLLTIENTYKDKEVDTDKIFEKGYSTKEGNTGLGLWEIRQILKKNNNLNLFTTKNNEYFTQQFEIYY